VGKTDLCGLPGERGQGAHGLGSASRAPVFGHQDNDLGRLGKALGQWVEGIVRQATVRGSLEEDLGPPEKVLGSLAKFLCQRAKVLD
jgi:hypothetical protein